MQSTSLGLLPKSHGWNQGHLNVPPRSSFPVQDPPPQVVLSRKVDMLRYKGELNSFIQE
jgi:hypothetical protein